MSDENIYPKKTLNMFRTWLHSNVLLVLEMYANQCIFNQMWHYVHF